MTRNAAEGEREQGEPDRFDQPDSGYPEEGPPGAAPDDAGHGGESAVREKSQPGGSGAPGNDDGTATGNPA